jgi:hypothetical protein
MEQNGLSNPCSLALNAPPGTLQNITLKHANNALPNRSVQSQYVDMNPRLVTHLRSTHHPKTTASTTISSTTAKMTNKQQALFLADF